MRKNNRKRKGTIRYWPKSRNFHRKGDRPVSGSSQTQQNANGLYRLEILLASFHFIFSSQKRNTNLITMVENAQQLPFTIYFLHYFLVRNNIMYWHCARLSSLNLYLDCSIKKMKWNDFSNFFWCDFSMIEVTTIRGHGVTGEINAGFLKTNIFFYFHAQFFYIPTFILMVSNMGSSCSNSESQLQTETNIKQLKIHRVDKNAWKKILHSP